MGDRSSLRGEPNEDMLMTDLGRWPLSGGGLKDNSCEVFETVLD